MKLKFYMLMMALFAFSAVSCSDDDEPVVKPAEEVAASYNGYTIANCQYFSNMVAAGQSIKVEAKSDNTVDVTYTSDTWGEFTIAGATVTAEGDIYTIKGNGTTKMGHAGSEKEYECSFEGKVQAGKVSPEFTFTVPAVMGGMTIKFYEGDAPAELLLAGSYSGYTKAVAQYFPDGMLADNQTITVTANNDGTVNIVYESDTWGKFTVEKATISLADGVYKIEGDGKTEMGMSADSIKAYDCTLVASIDAAKENPSFVFTVPAVMGGLTVEFFSGDMPTEE